MFWYGNMISMGLSGYFAKNAIGGILATPDAARVYANLGRGNFSQTIDNKGLRIF